MKFHVEKSGTILYNKDTKKNDVIPGMFDPLTFFEPTL